MLKNVVNVTDEMNSITLEADTTYTVNNTTLTHIIFVLHPNPKIGDKYEIIGQTGDQVYSCSWVLELNKNTKIIFDDITAEISIIGGRDKSLSIECISTDPLTFRAVGKQEQLIIDNNTGKSK